MTLERLFIEHRIYRKIEELENWDKVISVIYKHLIPFQDELRRKINHEDVVKLTEIKIKKITRYDLNKEKERIVLIENQIDETKIILQT